MKFLIILLFLVSTNINVAQAYVPRTQTIVKKMSRNNGRREYRFVREVILESKEKTIKAREAWSVAHGDRMKVEVSSLDSSNPWSFAILYEKNDRKTLSKNKALRSFKKSPDFFEPLFHDRSHRSLLRRMVNYRFLPPWIAESTAPAYVDGKTKMTPEPFITLSPMEGTVNYAIGALNNSEGGNNQTQLWVEQDSFLIKKGRLQSRAEFVNEGFQTFTGGLKLPGQQQISWNDKVAKIKLIKVERFKSKKSDWKLSGNKTGSIPSDPLIKEFYSRFR